MSESECFDLGRQLEFPKAVLFQRPSNPMFPDPLIHALRAAAAKPDPTCVIASNERPRRPRLERYDHLRDSDFVPINVEPPVIPVLRGASVLLGQRVAASGKCPIPRLLQGERSDRCYPSSRIRSGRCRARDFFSGCSETVKSRLAQFRRILHSLWPPLSNLLFDPPSTEEPQRSPLRHSF